MSEANGVVAARDTAVLPRLAPDIQDALITKGDLSGLSVPQRIEYYKFYCERMGLDPATQPFKLLSLQGKLVMYCDRGGVAQLCKIHRVSHEITNRTKETDLYIVTAKAKTQDRETESIGAVNISGLKGEALANALMKAETKAKRRATLDLLGLGILDETETGTIPGAQTVDIADEGADESTRMRHLRAALNKALQECKDEPAFRKVCSEFQKAHGKGIWAALTCHNQTETFTMLADEHRGRILSAVGLNARIDERIEEWKQEVKHCDDVKVFHALQAEFDSTPKLRDNQLCVDLLEAKRQDLGLAQEAAAE
jgi:hypothetical protein